jgi:ABC-type dipeptide/oligopeptide/nickel transport system permease component
MRFLRFLFRELFLRGIVFAIVGTLVLSGLYLVSVGATPQESLDAFKSFLLLITGAPTKRVGFSSGQIIAAGAATTLPLALMALIVLVVIALVGSSAAVTGRYLAKHHGYKYPEHFSNVLSFIASVLAAVPLFVGFWGIGVLFSDGTPYPIIAILTVVLGGLSWDATNFLKTDMLSQVDSTHAVVFSTLGHDLGRGFPLPGTYSGYLFSSSLPRFIPYIAGKVPAIIGSVTIAEIIFNFPGLGKTLLDALNNPNDKDLLIAAVFILLCVNAVIAFLVKTVLFLIYPRWYEKAI